MVNLMPFFEVGIPYGDGVSEGKWMVSNPVDQEVVLCFFNILLVRTGQNTGNDFVFAL